MPNITLSIPDDIYRKMKKYPEVKWSEVARKAIIGYLRRIEGPRLISSEELLRELGDDFAKALAEIDLEEAVKCYRAMRRAERKRLSTTRGA